jgi:hypothetical protein
MQFKDYREPQAEYINRLREIEQERLARAVMAARRPANGAYRPALAWLGNRMIAWGWRLRVRYGGVEP